MKNISFAEAIKLLKRDKLALRKKFNVEEIGIFGSFARGENKPKSDIDILVEFINPVGFFTFLELEEYLERKLGKKVDLVTRMALKPEIGKYILKELQTA